MLRSKASIKDLGTMSSVLGMSITRLNNGSITLSHPAVVDELLQTAGITEARPASTPLVPNAEVMEPNEDMDKEERAAIAAAPCCNYRSLVGSLLYLASTTCCGILRVLK